MPNQRKNMDQVILDELRQLSQQSAGLTTELRGLGASLAGMEERSNASALELRSDIDLLRAEVIELKELKASLATMEERSKGAADQLRRDMDGLRAEMTELKELRTSLQGMDARSAESAAGLTKDIDLLRGDLTELQKSLKDMATKSDGTKRDLQRDIDRLRMEMEADNAFSSSGPPRQLRLRSSGRSILGSGTRGQNQTSYRLFED